MSTTPNTSSSIIDPDSWVSAERQIVNDYAATDAQAVSDLSGIISSFQQQLQTETAYESTFAQNIASIAAVITPDAINKTLTTLTTTSASMDTAFQTLQSAILANNQAASDLAAQIQQQAPSIQQISDTRSAISNNITNYQSIISSFRSPTNSTTNS